MKPLNKLEVELYKISNQDLKNKNDSKIKKIEQRIVTANQEGMEEIRSKLHILKYKIKSGEYDQSTINEINESKSKLQNLIEKVDSIHSNIYPGKAKILKDIKESLILNLAAFEKLEKRLENLTKIEKGKEFLSSFPQRKGPERIDYWIEDHRAIL